MADSTTTSFSVSPQWDLIDSTTTGDTTYYTITSATTTNSFIGATKYATTTYTTTGDAEYYHSWEEWYALYDLPPELQAEYERALQTLDIENTNTVILETDAPKKKRFYRRVARLMHHKIEEIERGET